jgi:hypothetical protein
MIKLKHQINIAIAFGILALFGGLFSHLALTDIYHAETDVSLEWNVVRASALVFLIFVGFALTSLRKALRELS